MDNILYIQLHDPCDNMVTWCTDCYGLHDYRNNSGWQFGLSCSLIFWSILHVFWHSCKVDACWSWQWFSFLCSCSLSCACSARHQDEETNMRHVQLWVSSWNLLSKSLPLYSKGQFTLPISCCFCGWTYMPGRDVIIYQYWR